MGTFLKPRSTNTIAARRLVGRQSVPQQQTHMPLKVNMGGVIPVIFAASMLAFPQTIAGFVGGVNPGADDWRGKLATFLAEFGQTSHPLHMLIYISAIMF